MSRWKRLKRIVVSFLDGEPVEVGGVSVEFVEDGALRFEVAVDGGVWEAAEVAEAVVREDADLPAGTRCPECETIDPDVGKRREGDVVCGECGKIVPVSSMDGVEPEEEPSKRRRNVRRFDRFDRLYRN